MSKRIPEGLLELDAVMSNFDHEIDDVIAEKLKDGKTKAQYSGWNFCGYVWWNGKNYSCEIWRYNNFVKTITGSLHEIMQKTSSEFGDQ